MTKRIPEEEIKIPFNGEVRPILTYKKDPKSPGVIIPDSEGRLGSIQINDVERLGALRDALIEACEFYKIK